LPLWHPYKVIIVCKHPFVIYIIFLIFSKKSECCEIPLQEILHLLDYKIFICEGWEFFLFWFKCTTIEHFQRWSMVWKCNQHILEILISPSWLWIISMINGLTKMWKTLNNKLHYPQTTLLWQGSITWRTLKNDQGKKHDPFLLWCLGFKG
jgi:hypothetical protein